MRDRTIAPTNLLDWPRCQGLLPDQRLILIWVWTCQYLTAAGWGFIPIRPAAATLGLDAEALLGGLGTLDKAGLVAWDPTTGEVFVLDWYRFHTFRSGAPARAAAGSIKKVQSERLKTMILEKSKGCFPTATATSTSTISCKQEMADAGLQSGACVRKKKSKSREHGVTCWTDEDRQQVAVMLSEHGGARVEGAASKVLGQGVEPLPSIVLKVLNGENHAKPKSNSSTGEGLTDEALQAAIGASLRYYGINPDLDVEREVEGEIVSG